MSTQVYFESTMFCTIYSSDEPARCAKFNTDFKSCRVFLLEGLNFQKAEGNIWATLGAMRWLVIQNFQEILAIEDKIK